MKTVVNNAYWKELLDAVPALVFAFRIDSNDEVPLVYVNKACQRYLGFSPEQFVLQSELDGSVSNEVSVLIDQIAERSSLPTEERNGVVSFTHLAGQIVELAYTFELYQGSGRDRMIVVSFTHAGMQESVSSHKPQSAPLFVMQSPALRAIMERLPDLARNSTNTWISGEPGVGKRTLAEKLSLMMGGPILQLDATIDHEIASIIEPYATQPARLIVVVREPWMFTTTLQLQLVDWLRTRKEAQAETICVIISTVSAERLLEQQRIAEALVYPMIYQHVIVPPLRARREDAEEVTKRLLVKFSQAMELPLHITADDIQEIVRRLPTTANFPELMQTVRTMVLESKEGKLRFSKRETAEQTNLFEAESNGRAGKIVPYDKMVAAYLKEVLDKTEGKIYGPDGAAKLLKLKPTTLQSKLKKLGIK